MISFHWSSIGITITKQNSKKKKKKKKYSVARNSATQAESCSSDPSQHSLDLQPSPHERQQPPQTAQTTYNEEESEKLRERKNYRERR